MNLSAGVSAGHDERCEYGHQMDFESHSLSWRGPKSHLPGGTILRRTASSHNNDHSGEALLMRKLPPTVLHAVNMLDMQRTVPIGTLANGF